MSKQQDDVMAGVAEKRAFVPKLRFPEFQKVAEWQAKRLGDIGNVRMCRRIFKEQTSSHGDVPFYKIGTFGSTPDAYISQEIFENYKSNFPFPKNGAVLISAAGTIGRTVRYRGEIAYFQDSNIVWLDNSQKTISDDFLFFLYNLIDWSPSVGAIQRLYNENILRAQVVFPSLDEQQKIADCLSSLDELMAAQARKVDALKAHKKGLMQQLFPREGETQPRLRFPEFQNAIEWNESKLINLSKEPLSNGAFNDPKKVGAGYKLINVSDMYIETTIDEKLLSQLELSPSEFESNQVITGDIFFTRSSLVKSGIAVSNIYLGNSSDVTYDGHLIRFRPDTSKVVPLFAHYLFKTALIREQLIARGKTATMTTIGQADVASVTLFYPGKVEQQRIADCLSSLDALITAATQKLETLKTHKKGLMQQLFPSPEGVAA